MITLSILALGLTVAVPTGAATAALVRRSNAKTLELHNLRALASGDMEEMLRVWMKQAGQTANDGALCRHFQKHVGELFSEVKTPGERAAWAASMRNLIEIYESHHDIEQTPGLRVARMMLKYESDPKNHNPPPVITSLTTPEEARIQAETTERAARARYSYDGS